MKKNAYSRPLVVGIGGSTRAGSTSERALRSALSLVDAAGCDTLAFAGPDLILPPFEMGIAQNSPGASRLIDALRCASGVIIASPGYHGSMSGIVKNVLDYTEEMRGDDLPYLEGRVVGCIVCANGAQAMGTTLVTMRSVIHALRGWPTPYAMAIQTDVKQSSSGEAANWQPGLTILAEQVAAFALSNIAANISANAADQKKAARAC
jgi:FMN reductase